MFKRNQKAYACDWESLLHLVQLEAKNSATLLGFFLNCNVQLGWGYGHSFLASTLSETLRLLGLCLAATFLPKACFSYTIKFESQSKSFLSPLRYVSVQAKYKEPAQITKMKGKQG